MTDSRFSAEHFGDQPAWLIFRYLEFYRKQQRDSANRDAIVHARGWSGIFNMLAGEKGKPSEPWQLMPFPEDAHPLEQRISVKTVQTIATLIMRSKIPSRITAVLCSIEEIAASVQELEAEEEEE